ncbi:B-box zinc finger protein (macronuclear) [Tetrahymena thermophila SB210]|uniref:B-box zinc finger protein n=1 Tax=Tetrahymena thermophila (strain SB210) TaxID=312017 RepID=I7LUT1_TETTS|nr:B-box zinc finger protein [Tetrahymena thermophila SB210]EAR95986.2 B-box zinc finger protein [Tetrahymena thermophila SB210]|eukprot:XP_001016231.2 B-box zinc finger protein [Tetrahymena thermophila SB210]
MEFDDLSDYDPMSISDIFSQTVQPRQIKKKWKYPLNYYCLKHKSKFTYRCLSCDENFCDICSNKFHADHDIEDIGLKQKEKYMNYALDFRINNVYCVSNVVSYVHNKTKKTMLLFFTAHKQKICELDLETRQITRQVNQGKCFNQLIVIDNKTLLAGSVFGCIKLFNISNMKQTYQYQQKQYIKQIVYFEKYKIIAMLNDGEDSVVLLNEKLKIIRIIVSPIRGCYFNQIEKLNDIHLFTCSDIYTPILKWDIRNGQLIQSFNKQSMGIQQIKTLNLNRVITISLSYSMVLRDAQLNKISTITNKYNMIDFIDMYNQQTIAFTNNLNQQITIFNLVKSKLLQNITLPTNENQITGLKIVNNQIIASGKDLYIYTNRPVQISSFNSQI